MFRAKSLVLLVLLQLQLQSPITGVAASICLSQSQSQPNPIAKQYPNEVTGTINGTTAIIPIPYDVARKLVPSQYGILTKAYQDLIPSLPKDTFPAVMQAVLDHDVQSNGIKIPDFQRIALRMPFIDRLNDGYTSFQYTLPQLISLNPVALGGSLSYGTTVPGIFDPPCDGYASDGQGATYMTTYVAPGSKSLGSRPAFDTKFKPTSDIPYSIEVFRNVTNQPSFGSGIPVCDNYITLFNSSVTTGSNEPVPVKGDVTVVAPFYPTSTSFSSVWGLRMDNSFIERNFKSCESLQGYSGTGSGD